LPALKIFRLANVSVIPFVAVAMHANVTTEVNFLPKKRKFLPEKEEFLV